MLHLNSVVLHLVFFYTIKCVNLNHGGKTVHFAEKITTRDDVSQMKYITTLCLGLQGCSVICCGQTQIRTFRGGGKTIVECHSLSVPT